MRHLLTLTLLTLLLPIASRAAEKILPYPIHQHELANGLKVVTVEFDSPGLAAFHIVVRVGARNEIEEGVTGFAHFFEHMMFRGTDKYPKEKYSATLKSIGAAANANTTQDRTLYHMTGNAEKLELMFELESDRFMNLNYPEHDFKTEAGAVKGEYTKNYASPYARIHEATLDTAFDTHTYKHTTMGFFKDIVDMPNQYQYSLKFFERFYKPEYCTLIVVGDVTAKQVNSLAKKYFGSWKRGSYSSPIPPEPPQSQTRFTHLQEGSIPPFLSLHYKGPAFSDQKIDMPALDVLASILFSETSDLYKQLVLKERKVRFLGGGASDSRDPNLFSIQASLVNKDDMQMVKDAIVSAINNVKANGVPPDILAQTKSHLKYAFAMSIDNPDQIAQSLSHYVMLTGNPESLNRLYALYDKVSVADVKKVAQTYFTPKSLTIATISEDPAGNVVAASQNNDVVELKLPKSNKIVVKLMFRNGSISDPPGREGLTYTTASLMTQGAAGERSYSDIQDTLYPWAASYGAQVDKQVSVFTFEVPARFADQFYPILRDVILNPRFEENDFQRIQVNQQNYVDQVIRASSDETYSKMALEDLLFRGSNFQHMKQGKSASVKAITLDDVKQHHKRVFTRNNLTLGIAGNYSSGFLRQLKSDMAKLPHTQPEIPAPAKARTPNGIEVEIISKQGAFGSAIFTGAPLAITRADDEFAALMVANSWIGEHRKAYSRLYQKIRQTRAMNYGDYSYIEWYEAGGRNQLPPSGVPRQSNYSAIWIRPVQIAAQLKQQYEELADIKIGHAHFALRMAIREFDLLIKNGMTQEDFETTRVFLRSYIKLYAQSPSAQLGWLMDSRFYGRKNYLEEMDHLLQNLTLKQVNQALRKHWQTKNMFVTIVTDASEAEPLAKSLRENLPSPMSYSKLVKSGLPKEVLDEDHEVAHYPLNIKSVKIIPSQDTFK